MGKKEAFKAPVLREIVDPEAIWAMPDMEVGGMDMVGVGRGEGGWHE